MTPLQQVMSLDIPRGQTLRTLLIPGMSVFRSFLLESVLHVPDVDLVRCSVGEEPVYNGPECQYLAPLSAGWAHRKLSVLISDAEGKTNTA